MGNNGDNNRPNLLENQLKDINEWQNNANNPGYYVGSGKVPVPMRNMFRSPYVMLFIGLLLSLPVIFSLYSDFGIETIFNNAVLIIISAGLLIGGIIRIIKKI